MSVLRLIVLLAALFGGLASAHAERRVALVIGNGAYQHVLKLDNPANDAAAIADLLSSAGFQVIRGVDLSREQMVAKVSEFSDALSNGADAALVFYAGHGVQIAGKNYLIPIDVNLHTAYDVKADTIDADDVVESASNAKVKVVLLDACRDNPFAAELAKGDARSRSAAASAGLAAMQSAEGTLISFATSPGATALDGEGGHSPFTRALLDNLAKPGVEINDAMTSVRAEVQATTAKEQQPWENTNLTGKFYMVAMPPADTEPSQVSPAGVEASQSAIIETTIWQSAEKSGRREEYALYLSKYPKGKGLYSDLAEMRIAELDKTTPPQVASLEAPKVEAVDPEKAAEDALGLDQNHWREVQRKLATLGYGGAGIDGDAGPGTRRAIDLWQAAHGYKASGYLNKAELSALTLEQPKRSAVANPAPTRRPAARPAAARAASNTTPSDPNGAPPPPPTDGYPQPDAPVGFGFGHLFHCRHC